MFLRCLEGYGKSHEALGAAALLGPAHVAEAIRALLRYLVESSTREDGPRGCLMVCVAPLVNDPRVRELLLRAAAETAAVVERRLRDGVEAGELPRHFPAATRARQVVDLGEGPDRSRPHRHTASRAARRRRRRGRPHFAVKRAATGDVATAIPRAA